MTATKKKPWPPERVFVTAERYRNENEFRKGRTEQRDAGRVLRSVAAKRDVARQYAKLIRAERSVYRGLHPRKVEIHEYRLAKPTDETDFYALAEAIDQHLGWRNEKEREAGDYVGRIQQVGAILKALGTPEHLRSDKQILDVASVAAGQRVMMLGQSDRRENGLRVAGKVGRAVKAKHAKARKRKAVL